MKALYDGMAQGRSYGHGGSYKNSPPMTPAQIRAMKERARKAMEADARRRNAEKDFDESLFNAAMGGRMYEHGGTHPTEEEKERRETLPEKRAREAAGKEAFGDWTGRDARDRTPLTQAQIDLAFKGWPDDARELALKMYEAGTLGGDSFKSVKQKGEALSLEGFNKMAFKDGDVSEGYLVKNLNNDYRKLFKKDGSYELRDRQVGNVVQNVANELMAKGINIPGRNLKKVNVNSFNLGTDDVKYYGPKPVVEEDQVTEDVVEDTSPEDLTPVDVKQLELDPVVTDIEKPRIVKKEEVPVTEDEVVEEVPATTPKPNFGAMPNLGVTERSDRLGRGDVPTQSDMGLYGEDARPIGGGIKLIEKPTNEKGGKLYAKGGRQGKQISPALIAYLRKHQQKFAMGGSYRVKKKSPSMRGGGQLRL